MCSSDLKGTKGSPPPPPPEDNDDGGRSAAYSGAGFAYPVRYAGVSSPFGNRYHPVLKRYILHTGVDLVAKYVPLRACLLYTSELDEEEK